MKKGSRQRWIQWIVSLGILAVFIGLRTFQLRNSFWFFGDLGRDLFVLQEWASNIFHPPLLGPQTSVVSFNQSAWYYYYLFPFFLITGHSVYSTLIATLVLYAGTIAGAFAVFKKKKHWWKAAALLYLIAIHPQFVLQHRYVWNPSLVTPFLLAGFWAWWRYRTNKDWRMLAILALSLAVAAGLNFSLVLTVAVMAGLFIWEQWQNKKGVLQFIGFGIAANLFVHLPTIAFEIRHNFLLTRNLPTQELLQQEPELAQKISLLLTHLFTPTQFGSGAVWVGLAVIFLLVFALQRSARLRRSWVMYRSLQIAGLSALLILATPFRVHEHYVFGILTFLLVAIARLPKQMLIIVLVMLSVVYLQPYYFRLYSQPAPHTVEAEHQCMEQVCQSIKQQSLEPIFVNTQSASHNHQAREYVFWLRELGCQAIETQEFLVTPTESMAVIADRAEFTNGSTGYYELSQFGPAKELSTIECQPDLRVHLLEKIN